MTDQHRQALLDSSASYVEARIAFGESSRSDFASSENRRAPG